MKIVLWLLFLMSVTVMIGCAYMFTKYAYEIEGLKKEFKCQCIPQ